MANRVTASLTISYSVESEASEGLVLEVDDRENGNNGGNTSFVPGDTVYYLLYQATDITTDIHFVTAGTSSSAADVLGGYREVEEYLTFTDANSASLQYPASGTVTMDWQGTYLRMDGRTGAPQISIRNQQTVQLNCKVVGLLKCTYRANYSVFRLANVPEAITQVIVFVSGYREETP
jgi:hypothetical protein